MSDFFVGCIMDYVLVFRPEIRDELDEAYNWYEP